MASYIKPTILIVILLQLTFNVSASRIEVQLSGKEWRVWLDSTALWKEDVLHLPRTLDLSKVETNAPGCGWDQLYNSKGIRGKVPASFEELFGNGDPLWRYHGVGWFTRSFDVPKEWTGKTMLLHIEKARLRIEVYVNEKLAGYDIVAETPYSMDISSMIKPGEINRLAIRLTNPGGQRGWNDSPATEWGTKYKLIPGHDFGGLGHVNLTVTDACRIEDIFIKNILPANARNIELQLSLKNKFSTTKNIKVEAEIIPYNGDNVVWKETWNEAISGDTTIDIRKQFQVAGAKLWDTENPALYYCKIKLSGDGISDESQVRFGFRVFEVKANHQGDHNFYLNGKRIRIRSAIDWGYYWQTGFYPTDEQARKNVMNAKKIGLNCLSFHRRIGEPLVMKYADELGLLIYGEPGGMPGVDDLRASAWIADAPWDKAYHAAFTMPEKFSRMVKRDRNHPSVIIWNLVNEQCTYDNLHKKIFDEAWKLDNSRLIVNQSGGQYGDVSGYIPHMRPYEFNPRLDLIDDHTVLAKARFQESDLKAHQTQNDSCIIYWGEVRCYTGPDNFYLLSRPTDTIGYDYKSWKALGDKTREYFHQNDFKNHPNIHSPADLSVQAGRGLMYIDGRLGQAIQLSNASDGFAINGWSGTNQSLGDDMLAWYSTLCDEDRNLKGPASDIAYWIRPLQVAIVRQNGKYFKIGETALFNVSLFNEDMLPAGEYKLRIKVKDGAGTYTAYSYEQHVKVRAKDCYTQLVTENLGIKMDEKWKGGYITLEATLVHNNQVVADGSEQVLLQNRPSYKSDLKGKSIAVYQWNAAMQALSDAGLKLAAFDRNNKASLILASGIPDSETVIQLLKRVKAGARLIVKFDSVWANVLFEHKILKESVTRWGGTKKEYWNGNGWGYIDGLVGNQAVPSGRCIGTNSWEAPSDPVGFEPFVSHFPQKSHGAFFFRPDMLLTLFGEIRYGRGHILLAPSYPVDANEAFNDMVFFELLKH